MYWKLIYQRTVSKTIAKIHIFIKNKKYNTTFYRMKESKVHHYVIILGL